MIEAGRISSSIGPVPEPPGAVLLRPPAARLSGRSATGRSAHAPALRLRRSRRDLRDTASRLRRLPTGRAVGRDALSVQRSVCAQDVDRTPDLPLHKYRLQIFQQANLTNACVRLRPAPVVLEVDSSGDVNNVFLKVI